MFSAQKVLGVIFCYKSSKEHVIFILEAYKKHLNIICHAYYMYDLIKSCRLSEYHQY